MVADQKEPIAAPRNIARDRAETFYLDRNARCVAVARNVVERHTVGFINAHGHVANRRFYPVGAGADFPQVHQRNGQADDAMAAHMEVADIVKEDHAGDALRIDRRAQQRTDHRIEAARFAGVGRLSPVVSQRTGGPQYALLDASGAVRSFVTPAPGVNLRPFIDKRVGVSGQRGYLTDLQRQHISVQRVTLLDVERR